MKIMTNNVYPPIPDRRFDWRAYYEGQEERRQYGYGQTEQEAISDLVSNYSMMDSSNALR